MRARARQLIIAAAVLAVHAIVWRCIPYLRGIPPPLRGETEPAFAVVMLPPLTMESRTSSGKSRALAPRPRRSSAVAPVPLPTPEESTAPRAIDWMTETELAVARQAEHEAQAQRESAAFSQWKSRVMRPPVPPHAARFAWDPAATRRLEVVPEGLIVHVSDRCVLIITLGIFGGCQLGRSPARADLFAHLNDLPDVGDADLP